MGKKQNDNTPNVNATANRDIVQRLNFLYQASVYLQSVSPPTLDSVKTSDRKGKGTEVQLDDPIDVDMTERSSNTKPPKKVKRQVVKKTTTDLARTYIQCMRVVGQKTITKTDPSVKRTICSGCRTTLIPGLSESIRIKKSSSHGHAVIHTCLSCRATKRIPAPPNEMTATTPAILPLPTQSQDTSSGSSDPPVIGSTTQNKKKKHPPRPRPLPFFAREDAGHVVFRGNEIIS